AGPLRRRLPRSRTPTGHTDPTGRRQPDGAHPARAEPAAPHLKDSPHSSPPPRTGRLWSDIPTYESLHWPSRHARPAERGIRRAGSDLELLAMEMTPQGDRAAQVWRDREFVREWA